MFKIFGFHLSIGCAMGSVLLFVSIVVELLLNFIGVIAMPVFGIVYTILVLNFFALEAIGMDTPVIQKKEFENGKEEFKDKFINYWEERLNKKRTKMLKIILMLLPFLAFSTLFIAISYIIYKQFPPFSSYEDKFPIIKILGDLSLCQATFWLTYTGYLFVYYLKRRCSCGCVMSTKEFEKVDSKSSEFYEEKTKDTYGKIGEIYYKNEKVGDIEGVTGFKTRHRKSYIRSHTGICRCIFCGKTSMVHIIDDVDSVSW